MELAVFHHGEAGTQKCRNFLDILESIPQVNIGYPHNNGKAPNLSNAQISRFNFFWT